jgi:predicted GNAT family acetyltransferase
VEFAHDVTLVASDTPAGNGLLADLTERGMPPELAALGFVDANEFWAPWCVALHRDAIVSIAFSARLGPAGADTGVATAPAYRGRGFAAAATAGWAALPALRNRALFYSTQRTNVSSQRVAQRLGLRFLGATMGIS